MSGLMQFAGIISFIPGLMTWIILLKGWITIVDASAYANATDNES
ncbi:hypothetical protein [Paraflavitalea devenefica]|nr:hypothetical protein [Paraflavitalea devenefica]